MSIDHTDDEAVDATRGRWDNELTALKQELFSNPDNYGKCVLVDFDDRDRLYIVLMRDTRAEIMGIIHQESSGYALQIPDPYNQSEPLLEREQYQYLEDRLMILDSQIRQEVDNYDGIDEQA